MSATTADAPTVAEVLARIDAVGRPGLTWWPKSAFLESQRRLAAWDAAHPDAKALLEELFRSLALAEARELEAARIREGVRKAVAQGAGERSLEVAQSPRETPALAAARRWWDSDAWALLLAGDFGTGKTVAACWALLQAIRGGRTCEFRKTATLARISDWDDGPAELERLQRCGFLVLDDAGAESPTDRWRTHVTEVLDARYEGRRATVVTSNLSNQALFERLGARLVDRLAQGGQRFEATGQSLRGVSP